MDAKNAIVSKTMSRIKGKDTKIEVLLRKALWHEGIRYRKYYRIYDCHPDIVITKYKIVIFCDGVFWHGKNFHEHQIKHNSVYWDNKIRRNIERDLENTIMLRDNGWIVIRFWEDEILHDLCGKSEEYYTIATDWMICQNATSIYIHKSLFSRLQRKLLYSQAAF